MRLGQETPMSQITNPSPGPFESGVSHADIEELAELRETAREKLEDLSPDSLQAQEIEEALTELERTFFAADHYDGSHQCGDRKLIRRRKII